MSYPGYSLLSKFIKCNSRGKRRSVTEQLTSVAEARAATRKEVAKIRDAAVSKIEAELSQLAQRATH